MSDRIDHAAEARAWAEKATSSDTNRRLTYVGVAQVHATLALAEQQRIANLIAYASHRMEHRSAAGPEGYAQTLSDYLMAADFAIREGLGL